MPYREFAQPEVCAGEGLTMSGTTKLQRDLSGHRNGRLVADSPAGVGKDGHSLWRCRCDCGGTRIVASNNLRRPTGTRSCGCLSAEASRARRRLQPAWNKDTTYAITSGVHVYRSRAAWSKAVIRHYGNKCERCNWDRARCDAHHRVHRSAGGQNTIANGIVLCPNCHRIEHEGKSH